VSKNTVKTHVREIFQKLGVTDRTQAAVWALRNGFLS
jgi:DNA-binding NarL/FixJ family response regulator